MKRRDIVGLLAAMVTLGAVAQSVAQDVSLQFLGYGGGEGVAFTAHTSPLYPFFPEWGGYYTYSMQYRTIDPDSNWRYTSYRVLNGSTDGTWLYCTLEPTSEYREYRLLREDLDFEYDPVTQMWYPNYVIGAISDPVTIIVPNEDIIYEGPLDWGPNAVRYNFLVRGSVNLQYSNSNDENGSWEIPADETQSSSPDGTIYARIVGGMPSYSTVYSRLKVTTDSGVYYTDPVQVR